MVGGGVFVEGGDETCTAKPGVEGGMVGGATVGVGGLDDAGREGVRAYAVRQANMQRALHARFCRLWDRPLMPLVSQDDSGEVASFILDPVLEELVEEDEG